MPENAFLPNHDLHCHTRLSACCHEEGLTARVTYEKARELGYDTVCVTDHLWDADVPGASNWYAPQDIPHVLAAREEGRAAGVRCLVGCETEYVGGGRLGLSWEHFELFDFVVIPPNHMHMKGFVRPEGVTSPAGMAELFTRRLEEIAALDVPLAKVGIAHLTCALLYSEGTVAEVVRLMDEARLMRAFEQLARGGAGIELNASSFGEMDAYPEETLRLYRLALKAGCRFYCASDAHALAAHDTMAVRLMPVISALGLCARDRYVIPARG